MSVSELEWELALVSVSELEWELALVSESELEWELALELGSGSGLPKST